MILKTHDIGILGEKLAAKYLKSNGFKIIESNIHQSHKEIDIIAYNKEYIVFVEVKTRSVGKDLYCQYGSAAAAVDRKKQNNLLFAANSYLSKNNTDKQPRMDVIEVYLDKQTQKLLNINHIENAYGG